MVIKQQLQITNFTACLERSHAGIPVVTNIEGGTIPRSESGHLIFTFFFKSKDCN